MARRYTPDQLAQVLERSKASSWHGALDYLAAHSEEFRDLTYDQLQELGEDLQKLTDRQEHFLRNPQSAYQMICALQPERTVIGRGSLTPEAEAR
jgi:hypothetical protein